MVLLGTGMKGGVQRYVTINVGELGLYEKDEVVDLATLDQKNLLTASGRESRLPLKVPPVPMSLLCHRPSFRFGMLHARMLCA